MKEVNFRMPSKLYVFGDLSDSTGRPKKYKPLRKLY